MTKQQCEQLQDSIITYCDGLPEELIDNLCDAVVSYYNAHKTEGGETK